MNDIDELRQADRHADRLAHRCFRLGWIIVTFAVISVLIAWIIVGELIDASTTAKLLGSLLVLTIIGVGATLIGVGALGILNRPQRAMVWRLLEEVLENGRRVTLIEEAIGLIAGYLPENNDLHHWRGFASAVKEGVAQSTGTDGARQRPIHLGIVKSDAGR